MNVLFCSIIMKTPIVVASAFIEKDWKVLLVMCPKFKVMRPLWWRVAWWENIEETLKREMKEEAWIDVINQVFLWWWEDKQYRYASNEELSRLIMYFYVKTDQELHFDMDEVEYPMWYTSAKQISDLNNKEWALSDFFKRFPNAFDFLENR